MGEMMTFPASVEEFMEQYKMTDTDNVYSNGTEYVPIYRMKQWFEHCRHQQLLAIDAVPMVRCRECEHAYINSFSAASGVALCRLLTKRAEGIQIVMQQDDFCSYGERKEGADNG